MREVLVIETNCAIPQHAVNLLFEFYESGCVYEIKQKGQDCRYYVMVPNTKVRIFIAVKM